MNEIVRIEIDDKSTIGWVLASVIEKKKGFTVGAINKMKERGELQQGIHFKK